MRIAVLGATGVVGRTMLRVLEERNFPASEIIPIASAASAGTELGCMGRTWRIRETGPGVFAGCDLALFSAGAGRSLEWAPVAASEGAVVIDNSSAWRLDPGVPLVVPEVNGDAAIKAPKGIVSNPNCSTIQLVLPLAALHRAAGLRRVLVSTYQSVSGAGRLGVTALREEIAGKHSGRSPDTPFAARIAGNVIPFVGSASPGGWTEEEDKIRNESRKILGLAGLPVAATCVRVPVEVGHGIAATVELETALSAGEAGRLLRCAPGVVVDDSGYGPSPADAAGTDTVHIGRIRADRDEPATLHFWVVADNLRKGAATNAVQIAERLQGG